MEPSTRKIVLPLIAGMFAAFVIMAVIFGPGEQALPQDDGDSSVAAAESGGTTAASSESVTSTTQVADATIPVTQDSAAPAPEVELPEGADALAPPEGGFGYLEAMAPDSSKETEPESLGSLDPSVSRMELDFAPTAAGISRITFSDFWKTGQAKRQAASHMASVLAGSDDPPPMPPEDERYVLQNSIRLQNGEGRSFNTPILAAHSIVIRGWGDQTRVVSLFGAVWTEVEPGSFRTEVRDQSSGKVILDIVRRFVFSADGYDIALEQRVINKSDRPLALRWYQYGPADLELEGTTYLRDVRRFHLGFLFDPSRDPEQKHVLSQGMMKERSDVISMGEAFSEAAGENRMWPTEQSLEEDLRLSWFGATNRYFGLCIHPIYDPPKHPSRRLSVIEYIEPVLGKTLDEDGQEQQVVTTSLHGIEQLVSSGQSASWDMGIFAGPLERSILNDEKPYEALGMGGLILYLMSGCCTFCTFSWLADFMILFLSAINSVVFDWGVSIIILVFVVRACLHPITRKGQIGMQKSAKAMGEIKPELDKLRERFPGDNEKMRKEQMRLMQEKGVNPLGCATGMLPMFLQMPIWIALYAVLFFAFDLRQQWAFYGFFQLFDGWAFMGDLSAPDNFIDFGVQKEFLFFTFTGINLLPLLMGVVFFIQQKYMSPPPSATMTDDQKKQQKMMKIMMLVMFPIMLYGAPSGLTLYILTSSIIGTTESRYIRKHINRMEELAESGVVDEKAQAKAERKKKRQDKTGKMYEKMLENAQAKRNKKAKKPRNFKSKLDRKKS